MIDPNFWDSEDVSRLSIMERLLLIGLFSNADDYGKGRGNSTTIRSKIFPNDDFSLKDIEKALKNIRKNINVLFYEVENNQYYKFTKWSHWQRVDKPQVSMIPEPSDSENDSENDSYNGSFSDNDSYIDSENDSENDSSLKERKGKEDKGREDRTKINMDAKEIFDFYLTLPLMKHKTLNDSMIKAIESAMKLNNYSVSDCKELLERHSKVVEFSKNDEYKVEKRGLDVFFGQKVFNAKQLICSEYEVGGKYYERYKDKLGENSKTLPPTLRFVEYDLFGKDKK